MNKTAFYEFLVKIQGIAHIGMVYSTDPYAIANYKEINEMSARMLERFLDISFERPSMFARDVYPTPNVSVRTVVFDEDGRVLLVREAKDGGYSLPGGWCDLYESPSEAAIKECRQEAGADVMIDRLVGVKNRTPVKGPLAIHEYMIVFAGRLSGALGPHEHETTEAAFFAVDALPRLSPKVTAAEVIEMIKAAQNGTVIFD